MSLPNVLSLNFKVPFVAGKIDFSRAIRGQRGMPRRLLLVGHKLAAGALALGALTTVSTEAAAVAAFGEGSMLVQQWRAAKANADLGLPIDCIAIAPNGSAVSATSTVVVTNAGGFIQAPGEVALYIGGVRVAIGVSTVDTAITVATRMIAAINAVPRLPVVAAATVNLFEVKLTARWGGLTGNDIDVRSTYYPDDVLPPGLTVTIPAMAGGTTSPDVTPVVVAMSLYRATEIVCPFTDGSNMAVLEAELGKRWLANNMQDGMVVNCVRGTEAVVTTFLASRNSPHVHTIAVTKDATNPWETAAMAGAAIESQAALDPAVPVTGIQLVGYKGATQGNHWQDEQPNNLLLVGGCPLSLDQSYNGYLMRSRTNYTQTNLGAADESMAEVCWLKTASYWRWFVVTEFQTKYMGQGFKLAEYVTEPIPGQKIMTADLGQDIMIGLYKVFMKAGLMQNLPYYKDSLLVEVDGPNGKLKIVEEPVLITQHYQTEVTSYPVAGHV